MRFVLRTDAPLRLAPLLMIGLLPGIAHAQGLPEAPVGAPAPEQTVASAPSPQTTQAPTSPASPAPPSAGSAATAPPAAPGSSIVTGGTTSPPAGSNPTSQPSVAATTMAPPSGMSAGIGPASPPGPMALSQAETAQATFLAMTQFSQTLLDPTIDGRSADASPALVDETLAAYAAIPSDRTRGGVGREVYEAVYGKMPLTGSSYAPHWNVWASGIGGSQVAGSNAGPGAGSSSRIFATVVGADYSLSPQTRLGFAMAGGGTNFAGSAGSGRSDLFQAGTFARYTVGQAYVATALAYGWQAITSDHPGIDQLNTAFNANAYSGRIETGYRFTTPWLGVTAYAAGQFMAFSLPANATQPAFATNAFLAAFGSDRVTDSRSELGLRTNASFALQGGVLNLGTHLAWAHDFSAASLVAPAFQALPGLGYVASGAALAPNSALAGGTIELRRLNGWAAAASFDGEFASQVRSYTGKAIMRYAW
ncbi:autotransporter outer membrane beta-barrel domain-containing protein [Bradyrhizobium sp. UFLA05-109]